MIIPSTDEIIIKARIPASGPTPSVTSAFPINIIFPVIKPDERVERAGRRRKKQPFTISSIVIESDIKN